MRKRGIALLCILIIGSLQSVKAEPAYEWRYEDGYAYWYENGIRQGTVDDPKGVKDTQYERIVRGREIYDPDSDAWYWLDADHDGAKAVSKDVWMPYVYQNEKPGSTEGKWVRYDSEGRMVKGDQYDAKNQGWYAFELITGAMVKGFQEKDGYEVYYDPMIGRMHTGRFEVDDVEFTADARGRIISAVLNRVPYYSQRDERWGDVVIGEYGSISQNGCSCCVGASIIDYYTGSQYSPVDIASVFYSWGHYNGQGGHGTDTGVWRMAAEQFGMTYQNYLTYEDACRQLLKGNMITACVENGIFVSGSWTHNILLMGLDQNMRTYVYDPLHPERNSWYSVMEIQSQLSHAAMDLVDGGPWIALGKR